MADNLDEFMMHFCWYRFQQPSLQRYHYHEEPRSVSPVAAADVKKSGAAAKLIYIGRSHKSTGGGARGRNKASASATGVVAKPRIVVDGERLSVQVFRRSAHFIDSWEALSVNGGCPSPPPPLPPRAKYNKIK